MRRVAFMMLVTRSWLRSSSGTIRMAVTMARRSDAMGCCSARSWNARSSMSMVMASTTSSLLISSSAATRSPSRNACVPRAIASVTIPAIRTTSSRMASSSWWKFFLISTAMLPRSLAEPSGDVVLGPDVARVGEHRLGAVTFDQHAGTGVTDLVHLGGEEGGHIAHPGGLLHVVGDDHDRVLLLDLGHEVLDAPRGDRVERGAGLVHQ